MTRGRCGWLDLHRNGLSPSISCRFLRRTRTHCGTKPGATCYAIEIVGTRMDHQNDFLLKELRRTQVASRDRHQVVGRPPGYISATFTSIEKVWQQSPSKLPAFLGFSPRMCLDNREITALLLNLSWYLYSFLAPYNHSEGNGLIERFHRSLKEEEIDRSGSMNTVVSVKPRFLGGSPNIPTIALFGRSETGL
jgi:hypothetical protein